MAIIAFSGETRPGLNVNWNLHLKRIMETEVWE